MAVAILVSVFAGVPTAGVGNQSERGSGTTWVAAADLASESMGYRRTTPAPETARRCPSALRAVRFYARRIVEHRTRRGTRGDPEGRLARVSKRPNPCPRYLVGVLKRRAHAERIRTKRWIEERTLRDFEHRPGLHAWFHAIDEAQRPFPGTRAWLRSCSASEGGWGRWVPNGDGSGAGGWLQFLSGTFWRMFLASKAHVQERGYIVPRSASSWYSPLGQALAGAWGVTNGRSHEWYGSGC